MTDPETGPSNEPADPGYSAVAKYLRYTLSLPERALRSASAGVSGAARESAALLVPQAFQNSKTYAVMIRQMLDFLAEDVGRVERAGASPAESDAKVENFVARKAVGNFIDMANLATFHLSPLVLLAVVSDIAYGSQAYLAELADDLKRAGVIDETSTIHHVDDLLEAVGSASSTTAGAFNTPPLSVDGLRETISQTREALRSIDPASVIPQAEIARVWSEMRDIATREKASLFEVSGAMTLFVLSRSGAAVRGAALRRARRRQSSSTGTSSTITNRRSRKSATAGCTPRSATRALRTSKPCGRISRAKKRRSPKSY